MTLIDLDYFNSQTTTLGLKTSFTPNSDVLTVLIGEASEWVEGYCRRKFGSQTMIESHWGNSRGRLILGEYPVSGITSLTAVDTRGVAVDTYDTTDLRVLSSSGIVEFVDRANLWRSDQLYTVTYTLPDPVPGPVKRATALKVVDLLDPQYFPGKTKSVELVTAVQEQMVTLLEDFRRERLG